MEQERGHNPEAEKEEAKMKFFRYFEGRIPAMRDLVYDHEHCEFETLRDKVSKIFLTRLSALVPDKVYELQDWEKTLVYDSMNTFEDVTKALADFGSRFLSEHYSLNEINERIQEKQEQKGRVLLNDLLSFETGDHSLALHVTEQVNLDFARMLRLTREGFQKLAKMLSDDSQYADVEKITAESWIVARSPEWMKKLGFTVMGIDENKKIGYAEIPAQELIRRYGKK